MNFKSLFSSFASIILGALLVFFSILCFQIGIGEMIALGVVAMLAGVLYVCASLLKLFSINVLASVSSLLMSISFLVFKIVYFIIMIVVANGAIGFLSWVIYIGAMIGGLGAIVFDILALALKKETLAKFKGIFLALFFAFILVSFVFLPGGGLATLADIQLFEVITLVCYGSIVFNDIKLPSKKAE